MTEDPDSDADSSSRRFVQKIYSMGSDGIDLTRALALADALEDEEIIRKMKLAEGRS